MRVVNLCDSRVVIGCWAKGRSSSRQINRLLRSGIGYSICGRVRVVNVWVSSKFNPADDPTRDVTLRKCAGPTPIVKRYLEAKPQANTKQHVGPVGPAGIAHNNWPREAPGGRRGPALSWSSVVVPPRVPVVPGLSSSPSPSVSSPRGGPRVSAGGRSGAVGRLGRLVRLSPAGWGIPFGPWMLI